MPDELYQTKFGNLTENKPFGINVYKGMVSEFENKYRMQQKKAWQLDRVPVFGRCFEAGINVTRGALAAY